jgi:very-short-patch-repair endonuclease
MLRTPGDFRASEALTRVLRQLKSRPAGVYDQWLSCPDLGEVELLVQSRRQLAIAHGRAEKTLLELVGSRWHELPEEVAAKAVRALRQLRSLELALNPPEAFPAGDLRVLSEFLVGSQAALAAAKADADTIASSFGLPADGVTLSRAEDLAELASLAGQPARPEPTWINPAVISGVEQAVKTLEPLCAAFNERRDQLGRVFTDEVLALDLESLCQRFETLHSGLAKMRRAYRDDKKTVASVARVGKATKEVVRLLPQALEWQRLTRNLKAAEGREADLLGSHYYRSAETDFASLGRALENARRALEIAGQHLNVEPMRRQLGRGGDPDANLLTAGTRLKASIEAWHNTAAALRGPFAELLMGRELDVVAAWCSRAAGPVDALADAGSTVTALAGPAVGLAELERCLEARVAVAKAEVALTSEMDGDRGKLGESYHGLQTNWDALDYSIDWSARLRGLLGGPVSSATAERLASIEHDWGVLDAALNTWHRSRDVVRANFLEPRASDLRSDMDTTFADAAELLSHLSSTIGDIDEWVEFQRAHQNLEELKVAGVLGFCESERIAAEKVAEVFERACLESWADAAMDQDRSRLGQLRAEQLDPMLREFQELDRELVKRSAAIVIAACNSRRPRTTVGAAGIIRREAEKQRRHMPVRKLLEQAGEVAQLLKPCFMMSPLTVSQFLPPSLRFDAVIFDEASQVRPCDAINCVYRGSQLIVAGDDKQLPPTSFFEAVSVDGDDEWEEDQFEDFESIIKLSKGTGGLRELPLKWHYRSKHEDLIAYSNYSFYDGHLVTFPGASAEADDLGVKLIPVPDGVYRRGTARDNPREAEVVVDRILHWAKYSLQNPSRAVTVGVVAFSEAQAEAIQVALERRSQGFPDLDSFFAADRLDGFFVKNLENVQGDERDVMIFSVGYGRDENGKLTMNFGPLNREGGQRRLNVAITRARRRVEIVASITGTEPEFDTALREGPRHLQRYLDYAARGAIALAIDIGDDGLDAESPFEEEVMRTILSWGYKVKPQVGTAGYRVDIGVWHPSISGRFALGVDCDGRMYHSSRVARDRDRLRQEVLEGLGWRLYRIWGTSWYRYRSEQEERLKAAIEAAIRGDGVRAWENERKKRAVAELPGDTFEPVSLDEPPSWAIPYRVSTPTEPRYWYDMHLPEAQPELRRMIMEVVTVEGPIEDELLLRRVREAWGVGRAGHRIRESFVEALDGIVRRRLADRLEKRFTFASEEQLKVVRVPGADERAMRTVAQVSRTEQMLAIRHLVEDAHRVSRDELTSEVCHLLGWNRRGPDIGYALGEAVNALLRGGALLDDVGFLRLP